jgi:hypothetical protein
LYGATIGPPDSLPYTARAMTLRPAQRRRHPRARYAAALASLTFTLAACGDAPPAEIATEYAPSLGVDLATMQQSPTGLYTQVLEQGEGAPATNGNPLSVEYTGYLPDGTQFDASAPGQPFQIVLGETSLIPGFTEGLEGIRPGESRLLVIPPDLAYGSESPAEIIPPNATLVFRVRRADGAPPADSAAAPDSAAGV